MGERHRIEFDERDARDPVKLRWRRIADGLLDAMLRGLDIATARAAIARDSGLDWSVGEVKVLWWDVIDILGDPGLPAS